MTFFKLILVTYLRFLEYVLIKDDDCLIVLQDHMDSYPTGHEADATEDFLMKPLSAENFHKIRDQMLD